MALDAWLFEQHCLGVHPPTLRFYTWEPIAISLGYHQRKLPDTWRNFPGRSIDLVRRPSGGRAVLHQGDLTYAIVTELPGSRMQAYQTTCEFLIQGWRSIGVELQYGQSKRSYLHNPNCFGTATNADLVLLDGTKLIGSAQLRRGDVLLQHGSMCLKPDRALFEQVFATSLHAPILPALTMEAIVDALLAAASQCFNAQFVVQPLSATEWQAIKQLTPP